MKYDIEVNPLNPVEYLACCGAFEILARFDASATSWWELEAQPRFWLESEIDEALLLTCLTQALADWSQWQRRGEDQSDETVISEDEESGEEPDSEEPDSEEESNEGILLSPQFSLNDRTVTLNLDWWYETLTPEKKIKAKSAWKMYAGQQTAEKISRDMTAKAAQLLKGNSIARLTDLIKLSAGMTGRFGFDPRSSRNALDAGFSANDLNLPIETYPFTEMLAGIAAHYFFPHRTKQGSGITSSRGWIEEDVFQYALWKMPLQITLARLAAAGIAIDQDALILLHAGRAKRDKYSNFKMATIAVWKDKKLGAMKK